MQGVEIIDLLELGSSAGLNLLWDRYRYRYEPGPGAPRTRRSPCPARSVGRCPRSCCVSSRASATVRGVDLSPIDLTRPEDALLLKSFVWADQTARLERLDHAVETLRSEPPALERGDVVERLPDLLAERQLGALTVVFATAVIGYLGKEGHDRIVAALEEAGRQFPLAYLWTARPRPGEHGHWGLWARLLPDGEELLLAHAGFHGQWLEWLERPSDHLAVEPAASACPPARGPPSTRPLRAVQL